MTLSSSGAMAAPTRTSVRFKRCPACGDVSILSAPVCSCCDRTFVTTARFTRQSPYADLMAGILPNPYLSGGVNDFVVVSSRQTSQDLPAQSYNPASMFAAFGGLAWLGMMMNGQKSKGALVGLGFLIWLALAIFVGRESPLLLLFTCVSGIGGYLVGLVDVICICRRREQKEHVADWDWF